MINKIKGNKGYADPELIGAGLGLGILIIIICLVICIERIPVGYVGCIYSMRGGIQDETLSQGWHLVSPSKKVREFTIGNEQLILTKDEREGSQDDESFRVATSDNASIAISFQMSYRFVPEKVVDTFSKFKGMSGEQIINERVRTVLKSTVSEVTNKHSIMQIYSGNRAEINDELTKYLNEKFGKEYGIEVLSASIIDSHPDKQLKKAINNRIEAQQKAAQAKVEQETAKIEAETKLIKAKNKADIARAEAKGEADANRAIANSTTDELIRLKIAEARLKHGWVTVTGNSNTVVKK